MTSFAREEGLRSSAMARLRRWLRRLRRAAMRSETFWFVLLAVVVVVLGQLTNEQPMWVPPGTLALVLLAGGFLLTPRLLGLLVGLVGVVLILTIADLGLDVVRPGNVLVVVATAGVVLGLSRSRARLGVKGLRGESMLVDLRDRLRAHGRVPALPRGWRMEVALRQAYGSAFGGDFVVTTQHAGVLEVAVCDVSGKGVDAGTRALLLSGAFGGLLGAMNPSDFLPAANRYLLKQQWTDGFATVVHVAIDLRSGRYFVGSAGHPPAALFDASAGRWELLEAQGPALGLADQADYVGVEGMIDVGDAVLLYTDGVIERPGRDLDRGIDRLLGEAERLVPSGFRRGAKRLVETVPAGAGDDRALVLLWRE